MAWDGGAERLLGRKAQNAVGRTGLGLSICYTIIKEPGGTIDVQSKHGCGATFTITLPR